MTTYLHDDDLYTLNSMLDVKLASWTPITTSAALAAPDPGHYGDTSRYRARGGLVLVKTPNLGRGTKTRELSGAFSHDLSYTLPPVTGIWHHPAMEAPPGFSIQSVDRDKSTTSFVRLATDWTAPIRGQ